MMITSISQGKNNRKRVYVDDAFVFALYCRELMQYGLKEGQPVSRELLDKIIKECVLRRGKLRAMNLLQARDYTRQGLRVKLMQSEYDETVIAQVISYLDDYHYLDDVRYARQYISFKKSKKSRMQIEQELLKKGVSRDDIYQAFSELSEEYNFKQEEQKLLEQLIEKKLRSFKPSEEEEAKRVKVYRFLAGKGFSSTVIHEAMEQYHFHEDF